MANVSAGSSENVCVTQPPFLRQLFLTVSLVACFCLCFPRFFRKASHASRRSQLFLRVYLAGTTGTIAVVELEEEEERRRDAGLTKGERWRDRRGVMCWLTLTLLPASPVASWVFILWRRLAAPLYKPLCTHVCTLKGSGLHWSFIFSSFLSFLLSSWLLRQL